MTIQKREGPAVPAASPSVQLRPCGTAQLVSPIKWEGSVMKVTIRRT